MQSRFVTCGDSIWVCTKFQQKHHNFSVAPSSDRMQNWLPLEWISCLAPAWSNKRMTSKWPCCAAESKGVCQCLSFGATFTSAPASIKNCTTLRWPSFAAKCNAASTGLPCLQLFLSFLAPALSSKWTTCTLPCAAAKCNADLPSLSMYFVSAPASSKSCTSSCWPPAIATCKTPTATLGEAPASSNSRITSIWPCFAASRNGLSLCLASVLRSGCKGNLSKASTLSQWPAADAETSSSTCTKLASTKSTTISCTSAGKSEASSSNSVSSLSHLCLSPETLKHLTVRPWGLWKNTWINNYDLSDFFHKVWLVIRQSGWKEKVGLP